MGVVIDAILNRLPVPPARFNPEVSPALDSIISKAVEKDRKLRYQSAADLRNDLQRLKRDNHSRPSPAVAVETPPAVSSKSAKRWLSWTAISAAILMLATILVVHFTRGTAALTERATIVIADINNKTDEPVFDGALKQALAVALEQSPFLNIFSEARIHETLRLMGRSANERLTEPLAREICQRENLKALLTGSISTLGRHYVIALEATNAQTGDVLAREQQEAESKELVLAALGGAASRLRAKLGETLSTVEKYDTPLEKATTSSIEALKAYSDGRRLHKSGNLFEAVASFKRALELDPDFAMAYRALGLSYTNLGDRGAARQAIEKAFSLRERVSEREKLLIAASYTDTVTGDLEKGIEMRALFLRTYPREPAEHLNIANAFLNLGQYEKSIEEAREAIRFGEKSFSPFSTLASSLIGLNRFEEAKQVLTEAISNRMDAQIIHYDLYLVAFAQGDVTAMQKQLEWLKTQPEEYDVYDLEASSEAFYGRLKTANKLSQRAEDSARRRKLQGLAAHIFVSRMLTNATVGRCREVKTNESHGLDLLNDRIVVTLWGVSQALCGSSEDAQLAADEVARRFGQATRAHGIALPMIRSAMEIRRGNPGNAIHILEASKPYDRASEFWTTHLRGQAFLQQKLATDAASEFQRILEHRGEAPTSLFYPLAHLGLARAAALRGDSARSRKSYKDFLALWKDADPDIPVLIEAKKEYAVIGP